MAGFWDTLFDFNGDGTTDPGEEWVAFKMLEECMKDDEREEADDLWGETDDPYEWRLYCEDGSEYGLSPYGFDSQEEYEEALQNAKEQYAKEHKYDWRMTCDDNDYGIDPEDYETEEDYNRAVEDREENWQDYLSNEVRAKMEEAFVEPDEFADEKELMIFLQRFDEAKKRTAELPSPPNTAAERNVRLEESLATGEKTKVLQALREGLQAQDTLALPVELSMDPADGAGVKCVYVAASVLRNGNRWALVYSSEEAEKRDKYSVNACITGCVECLLRSLVLIPDIDGVLFKSATHSCCVAKRDMINILAEVETKEKAWEAICSRRSEHLAK